MAKRRSAPEQPQQQPEQPFNIHELVDALVERAYERTVQPVEFVPFTKYHVISDHVVVSDRGRLNRGTLVTYIGVRKTGYENSTLHVFRVEDGKHKGKEVYFPVLSDEIKRRFYPARQ